MRRQQLINRQAEKRYFERKCTDHSCQFKNENDKSSICVFDNCDNTLGDLIEAIKEFDEAIPYDLRT